jgi:hypothetical protein
MNIELPEGYRQHFQTAGVIEGFIDVPPGYFVLWHPDEIETINSELRVGEYAPGFLGFGGDGGGEMLAFDMSGAVYMLPMIGMEPQYANKIADSWSAFQQEIRKSGKSQ